MIKQFDGWIWLLMGAGIIAGAVIASPVKADDGYLPVERQIMESSICHLVYGEEACRKPCDAGIRIDEKPAQLYELDVEAVMAALPEKVKRTAKRHNQQIADGRRVK